MTVSVGIPVYNAEQFLEQSIRSVLNQSYTDFELIITNDGSTDRSAEIIKSFSDPRIVFLDDDQNKGISYRLNQQIEIAQGKYFFRMDADDIMFPDRLERQVSFLENNEDIDVVGSYAIVINDNNQIIGIRTSKAPHSIIVLFRNTVFIHPTVAGKITWFRASRYSQELNGVEDYDLWIRGYRSNNYFVLAESLLFYRELRKINRKTYFYRQSQFRKCIRTHYNQYGKNILLLVYYSYLKAALLYMISLLKMDKLILKCRNELILDKNNVERLNALLLSILK